MGWSETGAETREGPRSSPGRPCRPFRPPRAWRGRISQFEEIGQPGATIQQGALRPCGPREDERALQGDQNELSDRATFRFSDLPEPSGNGLQPGVEDALADPAQLLRILREIEGDRRHRTTLRERIGFEARAGRGEER